MPIAPQSLRAMRDELSKLAAAPEERLTPARKKQMLKDALPAIGMMGVGWGTGKTLGTSLGEKLIKNPQTLAKARKYAPPALALVGTGIGLTLAQQRRRLKQRRDQAEREAKKAKVKKKAKSVSKPT